MLNVGSWDSAPGQELKMWLCCSFHKHTEMLLLTFVLHLFKHCLSLKQWEIESCLKCLSVQLQSPPSEMEDDLWHLPSFPELYHNKTGCSSDLWLGFWMPDLVTLKEAMIWKFEEAVFWRPTCRVFWKSAPWKGIPGRYPKCWGMQTKKITWPQDNKTSWGKWFRPAYCPYSIS